MLPLGIDVVILISSSVGNQEIAVCGDWPGALPEENIIDRDGAYVIDHHLQVIGNSIEWVEGVLVFGVCKMDGLVPIKQRFPKSYPHNDFYQGKTEF
ncbi:hypothetical protein [Cerasicoccus frondis]|uniref:hypothetical protein n=1 Tax=Cerasicoccus frondis TaxID=490090 RepID=UPI00285281A2|nr:hypothetical protein [Cerasicoccus frondis]